MKHLIPFSLHSVGILVFKTLNTLSLCFQVLKTATFPFLCLFLRIFKKNLKILLALIWYCSISKHFNITISVLWLPNQFRKHCRFKQLPLRGGGYSIFLWRGRTWYGGTWSPLRNHVILSYPYKFESSYLYFPNNLKDKEDHL